MKNDDKKEVSHRSFYSKEVFDLTLSLAWDAIKKIDLKDACRKAGAVLLRDGEEDVIEVESLGRPVRINCARRTFSASGGGEVPDWERVVLLHYLATATGDPPTGRLITFKQVPDGVFYYPTFQKRTVNLILSTYGDDLDRWVEVSQKFGWQRGQMGDASVVVRALPKVSFTFVLWRGDEELPPDGSVVFDEVISRYLPSEDIAVLCNMVAVKMVKGARG